MPSTKAGQRSSARPPRSASSASCPTRASATPSSSPSTRASSIASSTWKATRQRPRSPAGSTPNPTRATSSHGAQPELIPCRLLPLDANVWKVEVVAELSELVELDGADDVDDGQLARLDDEQREAFDAAAGRRQIDLCVTKVEPARLHVHHARPAGRTQLLAHGRHVRVGELPVRLELVAADVDAAQPPYQLRESTGEGGAG